MVALGTADPVLGIQYLAGVLFEPVHNAFEARSGPPLALDESFYFERPTQRAPDSIPPKAKKKLVPDIRMQIDGPVHLKLLYDRGQSADAPPFAPLHRAERMDGRGHFDEVYPADGLPQHRPGHGDPLLRNGQVGTVPGLLRKSTQRLIPLIFYRFSYRTELK